MFTLLLALLPLVSGQNATYQNTTVMPATRYVLEDRYSGADFFNGWDFFTGPDPTNGFVNYVNQSVAQANGLISSAVGEAAYIGVDYTSVLNATGSGRQSVRISTEKYYNESLIIGDFLHMPGSICGTWYVVSNMYVAIDMLTEIIGLHSGHCLRQKTGLLVVKSTSSKVSTPIRRTKPLFTLLPTA